MQQSCSALLALAVATTAARGADLVASLEASYVDKGAVSSHKLSVQGCDAQVHYLEAGPADAQKVVLLIHGAAFTARTWQVVGTLDALAAAGIRVLAVDLPGYGLSGGSRDSAQRKDFVAHFLHALPNTPRRVLLVAASMGGTFGAPLVLVFGSGLGLGLGHATRTLRPAHTRKASRVCQLSRGRHHYILHPPLCRRALCARPPEQGRRLRAGRGAGCAATMPPYSMPLPCPTPPCRYHAPRRLPTPTNIKLQYPARGAAVAHR